MSDGEVFPVPDEWAKGSLIDAAAYEAACARVEADPDAYWTELGRRLTWTTPFTQVKDVSFDKADFRIRWYGDGALNVAANCLDRHLEERGAGRQVRAHLVRSAERVARTLDDPGRVGSEGELVGPLRVDGGFSLVRVDRKTTPAADDPAIRARAEERIVRRVVEHALLDHVEWHEHL